MPVNADPVGGRGGIRAEITSSLTPFKRVTCASSNESGSVSNES